MSMQPLIVKKLPPSHYEPMWQQMQVFSKARDNNTIDELWLLEHKPVFTLGLAGLEQHLLNTGDIPVVKTDRGGQVTYHGPGQLMAYTLIDLRRRNLGIRTMVSMLEKMVVKLLASYNIESAGQSDAPGVYVAGNKICSIGLRVSRGCSYHGIALNVNMDLAPFKRINPCGFSGLKMVQIRDFVPNISMVQVADRLTDCFSEIFDYEPTCRPTS